MHRIIKIAMSTMCISVICGIAAMAQSEFIVEDGMITGYNGSASRVVIPSTIEGMEIAGIESYAFNQNDNIERVVIGDGIEVIQPYAFNGCTRLTTVECPDSLLVIGFDAFNKCNALENVDVSEQTEILQDYSVKMQIDTSEEYTVSEGIIMSYNGTDTIVEIPEEIDGMTIVGIGANAFEGKTIINTVTMPDTVTSIGDSAFKDCTSLTDIGLSTNLHNVGENVFNGCTALNDVELPGTLNAVGSHMFYGCENLKSVTLGEGIQKIDRYAFYNCTRLEEIIIPSTLTVIDTWAMGYCKNLKEFYFPYGVTRLGDSAFYYCNVINNINLPDTVTYIGTHCFRGCWALDNIVLSSSLTSILYRTFHNCGFSSITIPDNIMSIATEAFWYCQKLQQINIPCNVTSIGYRAFYNCTSLGAVVMYDKVESIGNDLFGLPNGTQNNNVVIYAPEDSYAETYANMNNIKCKPIITINGPIAGNNSIGTYGTINYIYTENITDIGTTYIPEHLLNDNDADTLDIGYNGVEVSNGNTFMTMITGVPEDAKDWTYIATPYLKLANGTTVTGESKSFTIAGTVMSFAEEGERNEVE